jgi:diguanylate cyclase (GGDEF)-like protein
MLLALVYGAFLLLVGVTASALVVVTADHLRTSTFNAIVSRDASLVELFINSSLRSDDLDADGPTRARAVTLSRQLAALAQSDEILRIEVRGLDGSVLISDAAERGGERPPVSEALLAATGGTAGIALADDAGGAGLDTTEPVVEEALPILNGDGQPIAVVAIWRDAGPLLTSMDATRRDVMTVVLAAAVILALLLFGIFRAAQARLSRQQRQLVDATRRDALTGLLNHGAVVGLLAEEVEQARAGATTIGVALVDVDNFRLFNDTHGHEAGDEVLLRVARRIEEARGEQGHVARYGPDEFLLIRGGADIAEMEAAVESLRAGLAGISVQFGSSEQLPVSVSVGICAYPEHAPSVTDLLSMAAVAVGEAKASGGDRVSIAQVGEEQGVAVGRFDVLQGLVIAVDTKDRYTKRHSEDVARYAVFLAERLGLDEETRRTIQLAGLLHDIGKIGIPDVVLRKPSRLTADEYGMFQQHVALGDAIVRDVPNVELVRAGIRHHHERWDGNGYLAGLEGEAIPMIGRILAVADAFSAMTTTRPYRKALPIEEALKRLGDAAGSQLQEELVAAFITGIETAPDAPLPGEDPSAIWRPELWVA